MSDRIERLRERLELILEGEDPVEREAWRNHPITKAFVINVQIAIMNAQDLWAAGAFVSPEDNWKAIGETTALNDVLDVITNKDDLL